MENAQLILVPYNTLLHLETREASGLDLKNSVVIVDESHNLLDTVREIYSQEVFGYQLLHAHAQITHYITHRAKTASSDTICVYRQLLSILSALLRILGGNSRTPETFKMDPSGMFMKLHTFLSETAIGNIGLLKLLDECNKRKLAILLHAFTTQQKLTLQGPTKEPKQSNISKFLQNLKTTEGNKPTVKSGFVKKRNMKKGLSPSAKTALATKQQEPPPNSESTQYLNPNAIRPVLALLKLLVSSTDDSEIMIIKARTMSPLSEFTDQLLQGSGVPKSKITCFTTDHVVPPENICPLILPIGSSGQDLEFTHQKKNQPHLMLELGQTLLDLMALVPAGMVIFLPSYEYKEMLARCWTSEDIFEKMSRTKKYEKENFSGAGAALFAVVGGKMSEGINFKDDMGRCVVVNIGPSQGELYYEALCMKQVNQCIGRAVRHIGDYASMVLLDTRYRREKTKQSLPMWVRKQLQVCDTFQMARDSLAKFYSSMRPNQKN
ncbi:hypothetical protein B566_EDAN016765 [Ephemera danica]|nr:hypothetical protein B566_EDAN016765 [Ephemera danica]